MRFAPILLVAIIAACGTKTRDDERGTDAGGTTGSEATTAATSGSSTSDGGSGTSTGTATSTTADASTTDGSSGGDEVFEDVQVVIDFDDYGDGVEINDQYAPYALFSSVDGSFNETRTDGAVPPSEPNFICTWNDLCYDDTYVDFTYPVSDLQFAMVGSCDDVSAAARVFVDGVEAAYIELGDPGCEETVFFDLSEYDGVTRLELVDIVDDAGVGWDDFSFTAHVPR